MACFAHPCADGLLAGLALSRRDRCPAAVSAGARPVHRSVPRPGVVKHARCADSSLDPDQWFPVNAETDKTRREAATAIAVCTACLVHMQCLEFSLRHWDIGQHGVWGGLVAAERAALRRRRHLSIIR